MYEHVYYICLNVERVMDMFSEELRILDRNTVDYMVDQMQNRIDEQKKRNRGSTAGNCTFERATCGKRKINGIFAFQNQKTIVE